MASKRAFTIVELLIVIVIIGILALIVIVSYSGITGRANTSSIQTDLKTNATMLKLYYSEFASYPTSINSTTYCPTAPTVSNNYCLKFSNGNNLDYYAGTATSFQMQITNGSITQQISDTSTPLQSPSYTTNGLVINYDFAIKNSYVGTGTNLTDISGNGNNATINNTTYSFSTTSGGSMAMNGAYLATSYVPPNNDFTVEVAYQTSANYTTWPCIFGSEVWNNASGFLAYFDTTATLIFRIANSTTLTISESTFNRSNYNIYTFVKSSATGASAIYINGVLKVSGTLPNSTSTVPVFFGARHSNTGASFTDANSENIGFARVYNRALSQSEITQNFNALRGRYGL